MKEKKLTETSIDELKRNEKTLKTILSAFIGVLSLLVGITIYLILNKGMTPLIAVPIALLPVLVMSYIKLKNIKSEIESRES